MGTPNAIPGLPPADRAGSADAAASATAADDFSLVLGGPLYRLLRRAHLSGETSQMLRRRTLAITAIAWLPLLLLAAVQGNAWGDAVPIPFLLDIELHARLLLALPLLLLAELVIQQRMRPVVRQFLERGLIRSEDRPRFEAAIASAMRLRNSAVAEALLIAIVYVVGIGFVWRTQVALDVASWYGSASHGMLHPTLAGWWMVLVSLPIFQFLLLRWYWRLLIWARFLWQVSRLDLSLIPTHPDRCAGLGFLATISYAFFPLLLAQGSVLAGLIAARIFFTGAGLMEFKVEIAAMVAAMVTVVLGPLLVFTPRLQAAKRAGLAEYGLLAERYARAFDQKWLRGGAPEGEQLLGSADIQSLADMGNSYEVIRGMRFMPITLQTVVQLAVATLLPLLPLTLTMISVEQLLDQLIKFAF